MTASQAGDGNYNAAPQVARSFSISQFTHTITASAGVNGAITPSGSVTVTHGNNETFVIAPDSGYHVSTLVVDGVTIPNALSYEFTSVTVDHTISVTFAKNGGGGGGGGGIVYAQCADGKDNDGDGLIDAADPGCHTDGDASNTASYNLNLNSEVDPVKTTGGNTPPPPQGQVLGAANICGVTLDRGLRIGYKNKVDAVKALQTFLNEYMNAKLPVTGYFGSLTDKSVRAFQLKEAKYILDPWGLKAATGIVYKTSTVRINNIKCPDLQLPTPTKDQLIPWSKNPETKQY